MSALAIHEINDKIVLNNGESIDYAVRKKKEILEGLHAIQKRVIAGFNQDGIPISESEYKEHYKVFNKMPFACCFRLSNPFKNVFAFFIKIRVIITSIRDASIEIQKN